MSVSSTYLTTKGETSLFPNPAGNQLFISSENKFEKVRIVSINGAVVYEENYKGYELLNIGDLKTAIYSVQLITVDNMITKKLIKQ